MTEPNLIEKMIALEGVDLLACLTPEQLAGIASIATEADFPPGQTILDAARPVDALYIILDGSIELSRGGESL
jgi:CRP-like cAMP-binding protein